jgi:nitroreductase
MEKTTAIEHEIISEIKIRKSGRAYSERPIEPEKLHSLLEAARWAPSSMNEQPWRYIVATKDDAVLYGKVFDALADSNKIWAKNAPVLIVSLARKTFIRNGVANRHAMYDTGSANGLLSLQATALGLNVHQMGGFVYDKLKNALTISDDIEIATVLSIGYPGDAESLPEALRTRELAPRERYTQAELIIQL